MSAFSYWESGQGLGNITPPGNTWPEGESFKAYFPGIFEGADVVEFGCGVGRLAALFDKDRYRGVDICAEALVTARSRSPEHRFDLIDAYGAIEGGDVIFAHNVLMHIPDGEISGTIARFTQRRIVISEVMGRRWRRAGDPPVFNREIEEYQKILLDHGYLMEETEILRAQNYVLRGVKMNFAILRGRKLAPDGAHSSTSAEAVLSLPPERELHQLGKG